MPDQADVALACASLLIDELVRGGVEHACLTPGSRSTALALAAARHPGLRVHTHVDERSSAFFALGIAKATHRPALAMCSSGTAAANHLPAVVEASLARVPLVVVTADRPPELRDTGANQTIDQQRLFGGFVRWFVDTGVPAAHDGAARYWRSLGARAIAAATAWPPGPVHLNVPFREPLVPSGERVELGADAAGRGGGAVWERSAAVMRTPSEDDMTAMARVLGGSERVAVVAGSLRHDAGAAALCTARGWPLLAEPTSGLRVPGAALRGGQFLVADESFRRAHSPDVVLQLGAAPTTRAMEAFVQAASALVVVDPDGGHPDPSRRAMLTVSADLAATVAALSERLGALRGETAWRRSWCDADMSVRQAVDTLLDSWDEPFEGRVARDVAAAAPPGVLVAGSSMPVRDLDVYMAPRDGLRVLANRGASGIDGTVSTALGVAATGEAVVALLGDLALLHDASGLVWAGTGSSSAVLVVVDNDGGGIFSLLPQAGLPEFEAIFAVPHGERVDLAALARAAGAGYRMVERGGEVSAAVRDAASAGGVQLVHVRVDRSRSAALRAQVAASVSDALQRAG
jgi:2-succinyl-5-enolpyruvyl-6-hydroxy-3-cyclohexene-1-carboxylate synthase